MWQQKYNNDTYTRSMGARGKIMRYFIILLWLLLSSNNVFAATQDQFEFGSVAGPCIDDTCSISLKNKYQDPLVFLMPSFSYQVDHDNLDDLQDDIDEINEEISKYCRWKNSRYCRGLKNELLKKEQELKNMPWNDAPSTLRVVSVKDGIVKFRQYFAPYTPEHDDKGLELKSFGECEGENWCIEKKPMTNISYFVIENGADINLGSKGRIVARKINVNKYIKYKDNIYDNAVIVKSPLNQSLNYGVIVNTQAPNNTNELPSSGVFNGRYKYKWFTAAVALKKNRNNIYLALDRGETVLHNKNEYEYPWLSAPQEVAYLTVYGSGQYKGLLFSLGGDSTPNTLGNNSLYKGFSNVTLPSKRQCEHLVPVPNSSQFSGLPLMIASKNSRNGSDGGILRLCQLQSNPLKVSFVTDEDLNEPRRGNDTEACGGQDCIERRHANENFGFMAFQQAVDSETCELFPGPVQTWESNKKGIFSINNHTVVTGTPLVNSQRRVGFQHVFYYGVNQYKFVTCSGSRCFSNGTFSRKLKLDDWPQNDDGAFEPSKINSTKKEYWFSSLYLHQGQHVVFPTGTVIHTKALGMAGGNLGGSILRSASGKADDLIIYVHNNPNYIATITNGSQLTALLYSEQKVSISSSYGSELTGITGAVTALDIDLIGQDSLSPKSYIHGQSSCFESEPNYSLTITPETKTNTLCDDQPITFNVQASDGSSSNYTGKIHVTISSRFGGQWANNASFSNAKTFDNTASFQLNVKNNQAKFWLRANDAEKITVSGSIDKMEGAAPIGVYSFIPGGFKITPQSANIIAGKPFSATITAVACPAKGKEKPISMYDGEKTLNFSTQYQSPKTGNVAVNILRDNSQLTTSATIRFNKGESEPLTLQYSDAGSLIWNVTDPNCTTESCLLTDGKNRQAQELKRLLPDGLKGSMTINSRPWTFAICPAQGKNIDGTALGGQPLVAAGDYFYLHVRPVVWQPGGSESDPISTTAYNLCNAAITPNFFKSDAPRLNVNISLNEKQPVSPVGGDYGQLSGNLQANNHTGNDYLNYRLTWSEVGSVPLKASGQSDYLGMPINPGYRSAGRIYPAFFGFTHNELTPAMGSFTYMGQPFPVHWVVNAFNRQGKAVGNYDKFAPKLTAKFAFDIKNSGSNSEERLLLQQPLPQTWSHNGENHHSYMSYQSDVTFARQGFQALDKVTTPDGPYNSWQLWLTITNPNAGRPAQDPRRLTPELCNPNDGCSDPDLSKMTELRLGNTNPMRYGRMVLQDAAGDIRGPVAIPLRVEYWNGAAFETNADDSGSHFDGRNYCRQILYPQPDKGNSPSTSGLGNVDQGVASNEKLVAYPDVPVLEPFKQQVRFWQRLSNSTEPKGNGISCRGTYTYQPWLSYNWRKQGDEDPSAIVTFGVYQGNKRIIYRAEAGVTSSNYQ
ncbi:DUF6701 domain-containing protein [Photobacterium damselae]|uniref:DUF6701 domain-containing protein n=1 Tax=Photobacterium damselae TaxID=38293 RepID=UPI001EFCC563|nr:DUF6701 domain-containing protein [Photobacterium damselae]MCG9704296.1 hypothetical protein [Photobacterium damselae]